jgi:sodium-dependent dicarboxylate transporter 2/3/5
MRTFWWLKLISGPSFFTLIVLFGNLQPGKPEVTYMAAITAWIACRWLTEVIDVAITSLLPLILMPVMGILNAKSTAQQYNDQIIFLFIGGFILSFAIEKWGLHKRISLKILSYIGSSPTKILMGIMVATFLISMWMSNTATVMMLLSAVLAINYHIEEEVSKTHSSRIAIALLLGLAYSGSIGGMATLVGTPTNMIFSSYYQDNVSATHPISFAAWFSIGFPIALLLLIATFLILRFFYLKKESNIRFDINFFKNGYKALGKFSFEEKWVISIFSVTAVLWFTRSNLDFGFIKIKGWSNLFTDTEFVQDSTVAICAAVLLFIIPSKANKGEQLLMWTDVKRLPYDIILLFGSGFALAKGFDASGLSDWMAGQLHFLHDVHPYFLILGICVMVCVISEFASNVASIQLVLPILFALSKSMKIDPLILMFPATLAASLGYMLPVATAANTIVFGTKQVPLRHMLKSGFWIDVIGILLISLVGFMI